MRQPSNAEVSLVIECYCGMRVAAARVANGIRGVKPSRDDLEKLQIDLAQRLLDVRGNRPPGMDQTWEDLRLLLISNAKGVLKDLESVSLTKE